MNPKEIDSSNKDQVLPAPYGESFRGVDLQKNPIDEKTGFYIEDSQLRETIAKEFNECILNNQNVAIVKFDLDNLKQINDLQGRLAGDQLIVWSAEEMRERLGEIDMFGVRSLLCRQDNAGDEFVGYFSNIKQSHAVKLREMVDRLSNPDKGNFTTVYSMTGSMRTSFDSGFVESVPLEKQYLNEHAGKVGREFIHRMKKDIDNDIKLKKDEVLEGKIDDIIQDRGLSFDRKKTAFKELIIGKRITDKAFDMIFNFSSENTKKNLASEKTFENKIGNTNYSSIDVFIKEKQRMKIENIMGEVD